ncbi:hypothetical protein ACN4EG_03795 [Alkalinema pantanalense CENA528]
MRPSLSELRSSEPCSKLLGSSMGAREGLENPESLANDSSSLLSSRAVIELAANFAVATSNSSPSS